MDDIIKSAKYNIVESIDPRLVEVVVSFTLDGEKRSHYIFLNKKEGTPKQTYLKKAEEKFKRDLEAGKINDYRIAMNKKDKRKHVLLFFFFFTLAAALSMAGLFTYQYLTSGADSGVGKVTLTSSFTNCTVYIGKSKDPEKIFESGKTYTVDLSTTMTQDFYCEANPSCSFAKSLFSINPEGKGAELTSKIDDDKLKASVKITFDKNHESNYTFTARAMQLSVAVPVTAFATNCTVKTIDGQQTISSEPTNVPFGLDSTVCEFMVIVDAGYTLTDSGCSATATWQSEQVEAVICDYESGTLTVNLGTHTAIDLKSLALTVEATQQ